MAADAPGERNLDSGIKLVLEEIRDLRVEMRVDRQRSDEEQRRRDEAQRLRDEERRRSDEAWREEWRQANEAWREERRQADESWQQERRQAAEAWREERQQLHEDSIRREAVMLKVVTDAVKPIHTVGLAIVKTLNRHTQILERIDRRLAGPGNGRRGRDDGRGR